MPVHAVIAAWKTDAYPLGGNLPEEILLLDNGRAIYLNPGLPDEVCVSLEAAVARCAGTPVVADTLLAAWRDGYTIAEHHTGATRPLGTRQ